MYRLWVHPTLFRDPNRQKIQPPVPNKSGNLRFWRAIGGRATRGGATNENCVRDARRREERVSIPERRARAAGGALTSFDAFGTDISQYMTFLHSWTRIFMLCFLLNFSNFVLNTEGSTLGEKAGLLTAHTLGNVNPGARSHS